VVIIQNTENRTQRTDKKRKIGDIVNVEIVDAFDYDLKGKLIDNLRLQIDDCRFHKS
jgi:tRNA A37 methylthiotransferase MiaB